MDFQKIKNECTQKSLAMQTIFESAIDRRLDADESIIYRRAFLDCLDWIVGEQIEEIHKILNTQ